MNADDLVLCLLYQICESFVPLIKPYSDSLIWFKTANIKAIKNLR